MTLNQIFDNVQYGEKYTKQKALEESVKRNYDEELDVFYASKRIKELSGQVVMSEIEESKVNGLVSKLSVLENRLETGKPMSEAYRKMQSTAIMESCKSIQDETTKSRKVDSKKLETFGKILATAKYFVENNIDDAAVLKESSNPLLNKIIKEEKNGIENII